MQYAWMLAAALAAFTLGAAAHDDHHTHHGAKPAAQERVETDFGRTGDATKIRRTINIDMADTMRFTPAQIEVKQGDTIRFVVKNSGKTMHEMVLGTMQELKEHAELMRKHAGMEHDDSYIAHVPPGGTADIVWQFTKAGDFYYACLIPGHFEAGMVGRIAVLTK